jgi:hypothetical protein
VTFTLIHVFRGSVCRRRARADPQGNRLIDPAVSVVDEATVKVDDPSVMDFQQGGL